MMDADPAESDSRRGKRWYAQKARDAAWLEERAKRARDYRARKAMERPGWYRITLDGPVNDSGVARFTVEWWTGPSVRAQCFIANLEEAKARWRAWSLEAKRQERST